MKTIPTTFKTLLGTNYVATKQITQEEEARLEAQVEEFSNTLGTVWAQSGDNYFLVENTIKRLEAGTYIGRESMTGYFLQKSSFSSDELIRLPDEASDQVIDHIVEFWNLKSSFEKQNFLHKRGILLYGPPGGGKTSTVFQVSKYFVEQKDGIVLDCSSPYTLQGCLNLIRKSQKDRPVLCIIEDIDEMISWYGDKKLTSILDGQGNVNGVLFLATTNYPDRLPPRIINRPSRFDVIKEIGIPSKDARRVYLQHKMNDLSEEDLNRWVDLTDGLNIPQLKELIILVRGYLLSLDEAIARLQENKLPKSLPFKKDNG